MYTCGARGCRKSVSDPLRLELEDSYKLSYGSWGLNRILCKNSKPLTKLSNPLHCSFASAFSQDSGLFAFTIREGKVPRRAVVRTQYGIPGLLPSVGSLQ